jgi:hypothetical protein
MSLPHSWTDGYIAAVAWYALFNYGFSWDRLEEFDEHLSADEIEDLLAQIREAGIPVGPETPPQLEGGAAVAAQVARLFTLVERVRRAVQQAFTGPQALPDQIWAACRFPRVYMTLPSPALAAPGEVELVHLGDLPPRTKEWQQRSRLEEYPNLRVLTLFNMQIGRHGLGIDLCRLRQLQCLDLRENGFELIPQEVLHCPFTRMARS